MKMTFATSVATSSCGGVTTRTLTHATIERVYPSGFFLDGVEIINRAGVKMFLDKDAAIQLSVALNDMLNNGTLS